MRMTVKEIYDKKKKKEKIIALTAYDFLFARVLDESKVDIILVGDSLGMVILGYESTLPVTMRQMIHHTKAASHAVKRAMVVGDMPFGSYDNPERAVRNAKRFMQEAGADAVKLEGGQKVQKQVEALVAAGIPVIGHLGMTPQSASQFGGYKVQGKDKTEANQIVKDADLLDKLGVFAMVLECVPASLAATITRQVKCPTIGIGAGPQTDGQILVLHDMLGFSAKVHPKFVRRYAQMEKTMREAVSKYCSDVLAEKFPSKDESY